MDLLTDWSRRFRHDLDITLEWLVHNGVGVIVAAMAGTLLVLALLYVRGRLAHLVARPVGSVAAMAGQIAARTYGWFIISLSVEAVVALARPPALVERAVGSLFTIAFALQVAIWIREVTLTLVERRAGAQHDDLSGSGSALGIIRLLVSIAVFAIAGIVILDNLGVNVTGLIAGLGVGGIAVGLAAKGIFDDLFAALSILFDKPFRKGDSVRWDATAGSIEEIGLKTTRVRAATGELVVISNANLLNKEIHNLARLDRRRHVMMLGLVYHTPPEVLEELPGLLRAIVEGVDNCHAVRVGMVGFGASSLDVELQFDVHSDVYDVAFQARHRVAIAILKAFRARGIDFAFPTQTTMTAAPTGEMIMPYPPVATNAADQAELHRDERAPA